MSPYPELPPVDYERPCNEAERTALKAWVQDMVVEYDWQIEDSDWNRKCWTLKRGGDEFELCPEEFCGKNAIRAAEFLRECVLTGRKATINPIPPLGEVHVGGCRDLFLYGVGQWVTTRKS